MEQKGLRDISLFYVHNNRLIFEMKSFLCEVLYLKYLSMAGQERNRRGDVTSTPSYVDILVDIWDDSFLCEIILILT